MVGDLGEMAKEMGGKRMVRFDNWSGRFLV
jgi:hypothetical protein